MNNQILALKRAESLIQQMLGNGYYEVEHTLEELQLCIIELEKQYSDGWCLVPVTPDINMEIGGIEASLLGRATIDDATYVNSIYSAMISAQDYYKQAEIELGIIQK